MSHGDSQEIQPFIETSTTSLAEEDQKTMSPLEKRCDRCKNIDFQALFDLSQRVPRLNGLPLLDLGKLSVECPVCLLFARLRPGLGGTGYKYHLRAFPSHSILGTKTVKGQRPSIALGVILGTARRRSLNNHERKMSASVGFIVPAASSGTPRTLRTPFFESCQINPKTADYGRIREWLACCQRLHSKSCSSKGPAPSVHLKCIDCETREIVQIDLDDEYVALSYVWGAPKSDERPLHRKERVLPSNVSRVVADALVVVLALGKRYLWVDKYCVEQQEHDIRSIQIQNMDHIYEGAYATIIACAGFDAGFGLPGVTGVMRQHQPSAEAGNILLLSSLPPLPCALKDSAWITRGWTYQEAVLSRRCLFFTEQQVYFACRSMSCSEAVINSLSDRIKRPKTTTTTLSAELFGLQRPDEGFRPNPRFPEFRELADHIRAYTGRNLTFQDDALDAFRGVLKRSHFPTYYGIPLAPRDGSGIESAEDLNIGFARGLYWLPGKHERGHRFHLSRRSKFPSWSWVGWEGPIEYCQNIGPVYGIGGGGFMEVDRKSFDTAFWVENTDQKPYSLEDLYQLNLGTKMIPEL